MIKQLQDNRPEFDTSWGLLSATRILVDVVILNPLYVCLPRADSVLSDDHPPAESLFRVLAGMRESVLEMNPTSSYQGKNHVKEGTRCRPTTTTTTTTETVLQRGDVRVVQTFVQ